MSTVNLCASSISDDGYGNEKGGPKYNLALSQVFCDYSVLFTLYNAGELSYNWMGTNGFKVKTEKDCLVVVVVENVPDTVIVGPDRAIVGLSLVVDETLTTGPWTNQMDYPKNTISNEYC